MAEEKTYLELSEEGGSAHKFYEVTVSGPQVTIRYGRIGDAGQSKTQSFSSEADAQKDAKKKIDEKQKKGYAPAVKGARQKRAVSRPEIVSQASTADASPVLWRFATGERAFGLFVDQRAIWVGNEAGSIYRLDHEGKVLDQQRLRDGVKCLCADQDWLYAGSDDGRVYDLGGKVPRVAYIISDDVDVYWLDIKDAVLAVSDSLGKITTINHEEHTQWGKRSAGRHGWMVRCDEIGVYHGHDQGVTMYDWEDGRVLWEHGTGSPVLFGWQEESHLFVATQAGKVMRFTKKGQLLFAYQCDAPVFSCAAARSGELLFAGDNCSSIYCFDAAGKRLWKLATGCGSAFTMQVFGDRLYLTTTEGVLACVDASEAGVALAQQGKLPKPRAISAPAPVAAVEPTHLEVAKSADGGVVLECFREGTELHVRAVGPGLDPSWRVQFPRDIRLEGARYVVSAVRPAARGNFYRVLGDIRRLS